MDIGDLAPALALAPSGFSVPIYIPWRDKSRWPPRAHKPLTLWSSAHRRCSHLNDSSGIKQKDSPSIQTPQSPGAGTGRKEYRFLKNSVSLNVPQMPTSESLGIWWVSPTWSSAPLIWTWLHHQYGLPESLLNFLRGSPDLLSPPLRSKIANAILKGHCRPLIICALEGKSSHVGHSFWQLLDNLCPQGGEFSPN